MGERRSIGSTNGMLIGLLLGFIGLAILLFIPVLQVDDNENAYTDTQIAEPIRNTESSNSIKADELQKWHELFKNGAITEGEYNTQKSRILGD